MSSRPIILDATPLSLLCHPDLNTPAIVEINRWLRGHMARGTVVLLPEIADFEVRRELIRAGKWRSVRKLDALQETLVYLPLDTPTIRRAAELWAAARNAGQPTAAPEALDADVILAAQAQRAGAIVATENVGHLDRFVTTLHWRAITP